jgi:hypothetical protein
MQIKGSTYAIFGTHQTSNKIIYDIHTCNLDVIINKNGMLWLSQNYYDNYVCVILMQLSFKIGMLWLSQNYHNN